MSSLLSILTLLSTLIFTPVAYGATILFPSGGGTGSSTLTGILIGNGASPVNTLTIGSGLSLSGTTLTSTGGGGSSFGYPFPNNATSTTLTFNGGLVSVGSTTIVGLGSGLTGSNNGNIYGGISTTTLTASGVLNLSNPVTILGSVSSALTIPQAGTGASGYLSATDWNTFNNKQAAGNYITALTGDITASGPGSVAATLATVNSNVGSFNNANVTVNGKGLVTAVANGFSYPFPAGATTSLVTFNGGATIANNLTLSGITGSTQCLHVNTSGVVTGTGSDCGSGSSGSTFGKTWEIIAGLFGANVLSPTTTIPIYVPGTGTSTIENLAGVLDASAFTGSDIGTQVNNAYAAAPAGATITIPVGNYTTATSINFNTNGKGVTLNCAIGTVITYSGTGDLIDYNIGQTGGAGSSLNNCHLYGSGTTTASVAVRIGGTNGARNFTMNNVQIENFGSTTSSGAVTTGDNAYILNFNNDFVHHNGKDFYDGSATNAGENDNFTGGTWADCRPIGTNCVDFPTASTASVRFSDVSIDDAALHIGAIVRSVTINGGHFENPAGDNFPKYTPITIDSSLNTSVTIEGTAFLNGANANRASQFISNGGNLTLIGITGEDYGGGTKGVGALVTNTGNGYTRIYSTSNQDGAWQQFFNSTSGSGAPQYVQAENGFVGLGTSSPQFNFVVATSTPLGQSPRIEVDGLSNGVATSTPGYQISVNSIRKWLLFDNTDDTLRFRSNSGVDGLTLDQAGDAFFATTTTGCATFASDGLLYPTGTACGSGSGGSVGNWFTPTTNFGVNMNATSTPVWFQNGIFASTTSTIQNTTFAGVNVGIGTTSPGNSLVLSTTTALGASPRIQLDGWGTGSATSSVGIDFTTKSIRDWLVLNLGTDRSFQIRNNAGTPVIKLTQAGAFLLSTSTAGCATFSALGELYSTGTACGSGSGGTPGGSNTNIQFNDSSAFGGQSSFAFNKTTNIVTLGVQGTASTLTAPNSASSGTAGGSLDIKSGNGNGSAVGGDLNLNSGNGGSTGGAGGNIFLQAGNASGGNSNGGVISIGDGAPSGTGVTTGVLLGGFNGGIIGVDDVADHGVSNPFVISSGNAALFNTGLLSSDRTFTFPDASGTLCVTTICDTFAFPFTPSALGNSTSTLIIFNNGVLAAASSTIGNGTQAGGLTISGGATTTGNAYVLGRVGIGSTTPASNFAISNAYNGTPNTPLLLIASSTNGTATTTLFSVNPPSASSDLLDVQLLNGTNVLSVSNIGSTTLGLFGTCSGTQALTTDSSGRIICGTISGTGGVAYSFTPTTFGSAFPASATSTILYPTGLVTGTSTIGTLVASSSITNQSVKSALVLNSATGLEGAYTGSSPCTNQVDLSISATGVLTCTSVTNAMLSNSSVTVTAGTGLSGGGAVALGASITLNNAIGYPFTASTQFGAVSATSTALYDSAGLQASSTSQFGNLNIYNNLGVGTTSPFSIFAVEASTTSRTLASIFSVAYKQSTNDFSILTVASSTNAFLGVATTSPWATISAVGDGTHPVFAVSTSTSNNVLPNFEIDASGHLITSGPKPTCTTACTFVAGNDNAFRITSGAAVLTETITFANSWGINAPICQATEGGNTTTPTVIAASTTPTTVVLTNGSISSKDIDVSCEGIQ